MFSNDCRFVIWAMIVGHNCFCDQIKLPNYQSKLRKCTDFVAKVQVAGRLWDEYIGTNLYAGFSLHTDTTPSQPNHNVTPTHIEPDLYKQYKSQAAEDGCINVRSMLSIK